MTTATTTPDPPEPPEPNSGPEPSPSPIKELSHEANMLAQALAATKQAGDTISYVQLSAIAGESVQDSRGRGWLNTARGIVHRENNIIFDTERGIGLIRADEVGKVKLSAAGIPAMRRVAHRKLKIANAVDVSKLDQAGRQHFNTTVSVLGVLHHFAKSSSVKRLGGAVKKVLARLPVADALDALRRNQKSRKKEGEPKGESKE